MNKYRLGLKPVTEQPRVMLASYFTSDLPSVESLTFPIGHDNLVTDWGMLKNDTYGCCAEACAGHQLMLENAEAGRTVNINDQSVLENYAQITGFDPDDPSSDAGTDVHQLMDYWQSEGFIDGDGNRHQIVGYAGLTPGDPDQLAIALSQFTTVFIGITVPSYAEEQFEAGGPWTPERGFHRNVGGHAIPVVKAVSRNLFNIVTWGGEIGMTASFYEKFCTVAVVTLTRDMFNGDTDIDGVDFEKLQADLPAFNTGPVMSKAPNRAQPAA